jgi:hypothetical protein
MVAALALVTLRLALYLINGISQSFASVSTNTIVVPAPILLA